MSNERFRNTYIDGCSHFCTASVGGFRPLLTSVPARRIILAAWDSCRRRFSVDLQGFTIMPEHVHLLASGSADGVRKFLQYSLHHSSRHLHEMVLTAARRGDAWAVEEALHIRGMGKLWKERARCVALSEPDAVRAKPSYIHNNPVKRGLVEEPCQWRWSSWGNYFGGATVMEVNLVEL